MPQDGVTWIFPNTHAMGWTHVTRVAPDRDLLDALPIELPHRGPISGDDDKATVLQVLWGKKQISAPNIYCLVLSSSNRHDSNIAIR